MHLHIISIFWVLIWPLTTADDYVPEVRKSTLECSNDCHFSYPIRLGESDTIIHEFQNRLDISFDNGENWHTVDAIENVTEVTVDPFYKERVFVFTRSDRSKNMYVPEDQGKNWTKFSLPEDTEGDYKACSIITHPLYRNLLLLDCDIMHESRNSFGGMRISFEGKTVYGSNDGGESFGHILMSPLDNSRFRCKFAASSKGPRVSDDGIYCIQIIEKSEDAPLQPSNQSNSGWGGISFQQKHQWESTIFYTRDLGNTKKTFDEFNDYLAEEIFVFSSGFGVVVSDGGDIFQGPQRLLIHRDGSSKVAQLPDGVVICYVRSLSEDDQGRLLLRADVQENRNSRRSERLLISSSSDFNFSFQEPDLQLDSDHTKTLVPVDNLKGTLWATFKIFKNTDEKVKGSDHKGTDGNSKESALQKQFAFSRYFQEKGNWFQEVLHSLNWLRRLAYLLKDFILKESHHNIRLHYVTKGSFDNGKTWNDLKIVDPSRKHRNIFKCDIDDVEHCSLQFSDPHAEDSTAGIIVKIGTAGDYYDPDSYSDNMTFISRDGGISWELVFEIAMKVRLLDFGNIMVAIPKNSGTYTKFFFSLDQGRTWAEYLFDRPIRAEVVVLDGLGLKVHMGFKTSKESIFDGSDEQSVKYISYSIDFSNAFEGNACSANDWEAWYLSNGTCIDGVRYSFDRRKPDSKCLMRKTFEKLELHEEKCG